MKMFFKQTAAILLPVLLSGAVVPALSGCAHTDFSPGGLIRAGDFVRVDYTCRLENGDPVVTTDPAAAKEMAAHSTGIFGARENPAPVPMTAGTTPTPAAAASGMPADQLQDLYWAIEEKLGPALVGQPWNETFRMKITADSREDLPETSRMISLAAAIRAPKRMVVAEDEYMKITGADRPAEVGHTVGMYTGVVGKVASIQDKQVEIVFSAVSDRPVKAGLSLIQVTDKGDYFLLEKLVNKGDLIRTGPHLGQVTEKAEGMFTVDYSHPFGGRTLVCDVLARPAPKESPAASAPSPPASESGVAAAAGGAGQGDLVTVEYTARLKNGKLIYTTRAGIDAAPEGEKVDWYQAPERFRPEVVVAGEKNNSPGLGQAVLNMKAGQHKQVTLSPEEGFGLTNPALIRQFDKVNSYPRTQKLSLQEWSGRFQQFPVKGHVHDLDEFLKARVTAVEGDRVTLDVFPSAAEKEIPLGRVKIRIIQDRVEVTLEPKMGAEYLEKGDKGPVKGIIVSSSDSQFTVDFNHPLAGKEIDLDIEAVSVTPVAALLPIEAVLLEDYDQGLEKSRQTNKPMVLVLYAAWCKYSRMFLEQTLPSPRVRMLADDFVWVKVDSGVDKSLNELYQQKSFPLTVILSPGGEELARIDGYKEAADFHDILVLVKDQKSGDKR